MASQPIGAAPWSFSSQWGSGRHITKPADLSPAAAAGGLGLVSVSDYSPSRAELQQATLLTTHASSACPHQHRVKLRVETSSSPPWPRRGAAARGGSPWRCRSTGPDVTRTWSAVRSYGARSQLSARCVHPPPPVWAEPKVRQTQCGQLAA